jgi:hypothetical protein
MFWVRNGATHLGPIGLPNLFAVRNIDRGWLIALAWSPEARAEDDKMIARFGIIIYWCGLAIACVCMLAALTIVAAIFTGDLVLAFRSARPIFPTGVFRCRIRNKPFHSIS